jgi:methylmalonyl-CoA mutase
MPDNSQNKEEIKFDKELNLKSDFSTPTYEEWKAIAEEHLKGVPFEEALSTHTYEGIVLQPIYCQKDIKDLPYLGGKPGFGNYARGISAEGYLTRSWEICQAIHCGLPEDFNRALKHDMERGQTAVNLTPDMATRMGLDIDEAEIGDVGADGVSVANLNDLSTALKDIDIEKFPIHIDAGFSGLKILMLLVALFTKQGKKIDKINGSIDTDPLGFMAIHGKLPISLEKAYGHMAQVTSWTVKNAPQIKTIGISGVPYHNAGASAVQELACALATAVEYIDRMMERNLTIDDIAGSMRFSFGIGPFYFMEVAKLRAARMLWAKIVETYEGNKESQKMTIHGVTSFYNQTMYDPYVNMLRTFTEAFSAVVGGVDSLQTNPFDETFGQPEKFSRRMARNTQVILAEEAHLTQLIDPAGGAYYVEKLTIDVAKKTWALFQEIESRGGIFKALKDGFPQAEIERTAEKRKKDLAERKTVMVGINAFANINEKKRESRVPDYKKIHKTRVKQLKAYWSTVSGKEHRKISDKLLVLAGRAPRDLIHAGVEALLAGATIGEFLWTPRIDKPPSIKPLRIHRISEIFEVLRDTVDAYETKTGAKPLLFLAAMGPLTQYKERADFSTDFFKVGGFDVIGPKDQGFETPAAVVDAAIESKAQVVAICSSDSTYPDLVPPITKELKEKNPDVRVVVVGYPKDQVETYTEAGVDAFIYEGVDVHLILSKILEGVAPPANNGVVPPTHRKMKVLS